MKTILKYIALNILLLLGYAALARLCFRPAFSDDMRPVGFFLILALAHIIFCFFAGIIMDMRGNKSKARMFLISAATPLVMALITAGFAVMGF